MPLSNRIESLRAGIHKPAFRNAENQRASMNSTSTLQELLGQTQESWQKTATDVGASIAG